MREKDLLKGYKPKTNPDTVNDYLRKPESFVYKILDEIGKPSLKKLKTIIQWFEKYQKKAIENPGGIQEGRVYIGADPEQYFPSEEEVLASELGKMIINVIKSNSEEEIKKYMKKENITVHKLEFNEITYRHVDVMGSGRFFYAEKVEPKSKIQLSQYY